MRIYKQFMAQPQDEDHILVLERQKQPSMLGSQAFISWVKDRFFEAKIDKEIPASKELAPDMDTIISEVSRYYEARRATLKAVRLPAESLFAIAGIRRH